MWPTLYPDVALNAEYVDFVVRGQGEDTFAELLRALAARDTAALAAVKGLSWRRDGAVVNNAERAINGSRIAPRLRYDKLADPKAYLVKTFLGQRTAAHQASLGCRFRCTFCGVAAMFGGATVLPPADRFDRDLALLKHGIGADSIQFYDHNFFDREEDMVPLLEVLARHELPWWCYARSDALEFGSHLRAFALSLGTRRFEPIPLRGHAVETAEDCLAVLLDSSQLVGSLLQ